MGDRTWIEITFNEYDLVKVEDVLGNFDEKYESGNQITGRTNGVDCGGIDELKELSETGLTFYGQHGPGTEYDAGVFACHNKRLVSIMATYDGMPVIPFHHDGVDAEDEKDILEYYGVLNDADKELEGIKKGGE